MNAIKITTAHQQSPLIKVIISFIVTHKINQSIIKKYDKIIVLRDGNVVEYGNFDELMANKDYFYSLYNVSL